MALLKKGHPNLYRQLVGTAGVYLFLDENKKPIYVGKAVNLRARVKQHFTNGYDPKEKLITKHTHFVKIQETNSEFEALVVEANLIQKYLPKYNVALKDDKSRLYIVVTREKYPKIRLERKRNLATNEFRFIFGPLNSTLTGRQLLRRIRQVIPFCIEKNITVKSCFYSQIGLCDPCPNAIESLANKQEKERQRREYLTNISRVIRLFKGSGQGLLKELKQDLEKLSTELRFEEAILLRNRIHYLNELFQKKLVFDERLFEANYIDSLREKENEELKRLLKFKKLGRVECYDVSNLSFKEATASMVVFETGRALTDEYRRFRIKLKRRFDPEMLFEVLSRRFRHGEWARPDLIVIDGGKPQLLGIVPKLSQIYLQVPVVVGLAKNPDRLIFADGHTLNQEDGPDAFHYLARIRDEAHRFAKKYHLTLRRKNLTKILKSSYNK